MNVLDPVGENGKIDQEKASKNQQDSLEISNALKGIIEESQLLENDILKLYVKDAQFDVIVKA